MGKNLGLELLNLSVHVLGSSNSNQDEEESNYAEGGKEVELVFDKTDHCWAALLI